MSFREGDIVIINGLKNPKYKSWNGQQAWISNYNHEKQRYHVQLKQDHEQQALLKPINLKHCELPATAPLTNRHKYHMDPFNPTNRSLMAKLNNAITHNNKGCMLMQQKKYHESLKELHLALDIKRTIFSENDNRIAITTLLLADSYLGMKQFDKAMQFCQETIKIRKATNDPELRFAYECMDDIKKAMKAHKNANK
eukprot:76660_1